MVESSSSTNSVCKMAIGIGAASLISLNFTPDLIHKAYADSYMYQYEYTSETQYFYQLKHETMQTLLHQNDSEPIIDVPIVKKIKVKFNKPQKLSFNAVENEEGFLG